MMLPSRNPRNRVSSASGPPGRRGCDGPDDGALGAVSEETAIV
jgi:hypothetical protein